MAPPESLDQQEAGAWRAGTAERSITPNEPMWMAGFSFRDGPSEGVERDLTATALALEDANGNRAVILSVELLFVTDGIRDQLIEDRLSRVDLAPDELLINATHTHGGPEYRDLKLDMYADQPAAYRERADRYCDRLVEQLGAAVEDALEDLAPARLAYDHARAGFAMCRRRPTHEGIAHVPNPDGPVDHDVQVLTVRSDGDIRAILFGYACHTTAVIRCDGWMQFNGDWAGLARAELADSYPDATTMFVQGCAGDQNPYPRGSRALADLHGRTIANAVEVAVDTSRHAVDGPLRTNYGEQPIALQEPPDRQTLETLAESDDRVDRVRGQRLLTELDDKGTIDTCRHLPVHGIGIGDDLVFLGLGGEVLVEYARTLRREYDGPCWVTGYTNSDFTYVPTAQALYEGGYEADVAFRNAALPGPPRPSIEDRVRRRSRTMIDRVSGPQ